MSAEIKQLPSSRLDRAQSVLEVLDYCKEQEFDSVIVFGIDAEGCVLIKHSNINSITKLVGALERAKYELIRDDLL